MQQNIDINTKYLCYGFNSTEYRKQSDYILFANRGAATVNLCVACSVR